jgi:hypothetical protein
MGFTALIAGGLGAAGSLGSAFIGANASKQAAQLQQQSQMAALAQQQQMFGVGQQAVNPFIQAGQGVLPTLEALQNPGTAASTLAKTPGFQFSSQYGTMAAQNALAGKGQGASAGPLATAISQYNQGLASQNYFQTIQSLQNTAGIGGGAASSLLGGAINAGNAQAGTLGNIGNAGAAGVLGQANAYAGGLTGAGNSLGNALLLGAAGGGGAGNGIYGYVQGYTNPSQFNNVPATSLTDAQANGYGAANGLVPY